MAKNHIDIDQFIKELDEFLHEWGVALRADCTEDWDEDINGEWFSWGARDGILVEDTAFPQDNWWFEVLPTDAE